MSKVICKLHTACAIKATAIEMNVNANGLVQYLLGVKHKKNLISSMNS